MENLDVYIRELTILGGARTLFLALFAIDLALTLAHSNQERKGRLWDYFGDIAGVRLSDTFGLLFFFGGLTLALWAVSVVGFLGPWLLDKISVARWLLDGSAFARSIGCVAFLIGARLSDGWYSHIRLHRAGFQPNPGLSTVPFYLAEAAVLAIVFAPGLASHAVASVSGLFLGWFAFFIVLPALKGLRSLGFHRQSPWIAGEPRPQ